MAVGAATIITTKQLHFRTHHYHPKNISYTYSVVLYYVYALYVELETHEINAQSAGMVPFCKSKGAH